MDDDYSKSALLCWPVQMLPSSEPTVRGLHVTALYMPDVTDIPRKNIFDAINKDNGYLTGAFNYRLADVTGTAAFGPEQNYPVFTVGIGDPVPTRRGKDMDHLLTENVTGLKYLLDYSKIPYDKTYSYYNPHVTVSLAQVLRPPKQVLLRPMELWYRDDEPVAL